MIESRPLQDPYAVEYRAGTHVGRADTIKNGVGGTTGMRPHELLEAALASCMTITARMAADDLGICAEGIRVAVELERNEGTTVFHYRLELPDGLSEAEIGTFEARVGSSPVRRTLSAGLRFQAGLGEPSEAGSKEL